MMLSSRIQRKSKHGQYGLESSMSGNSASMAAAPPVYGNQALLRKMQQQKPGIVSLRPSQTASLQRKCACDETAKKPQEGMMIQTKLAIGSPSDALEQEADQVAEQVIGMPEGMSESPPLALSSASGSTTQRKCAACEEEDKKKKKLQTKRTSSADSDRDLDAGMAEQVAGRGGEPLPSELGTYFESRFGLDFSNVRVHTGSEAAEGAGAVQARAYTIGRDIVFGHGEYAPETTEGKRLLAHELTHVVQQGALGDSSAHATPSIQRDEQNTCSLRNPLYGWDNIRNLSRDRLIRAGFVFCGPDRDMDPDLWERWVHPTKGVLHFQVKWKEDPPPKNCDSNCLLDSDDEDSCRQCCIDTFPDENDQCRRTCNAGCDNKL